MKLLVVVDMSLDEQEGEEAAHKSRALAARQIALQQEVVQEQEQEQGEWHKASIKREPVVSHYLPVAAAG